MKRLFYFLSLASILVSTLSSCSDDDNNGGDGEVTDSGCYILNNGDWGGNSSSLQFYDFTTGIATSPIYTSDIFAKKNSDILGDLAQDLLWINGKLFVTVSGSQKLEVLDESGKRLRDFYSYSSTMAYPRMMATDGNNVYVTNYDGHVYVYDAATADSITVYQVGSYPEGISYCNGYLVVNNSDYGACDGDASVSIIKLSDGSVREIKNNICNPQPQSVVCNGKVYIIDSGNYGDIEPSILVVSPESGTVTSLNVAASLLAVYDDYLYYVNKSWNYTLNNGLGDWDCSPLYRMDVVNGVVEEFLQKDAVRNINSLSVNPVNGDIFIGYNADEAGALGYMRIYDANGMQRGLFDVGLFTCGARFKN